MSTNTLKSKTRNKKRGGFTLIELLIVMAIIGMLAALVGPSVFKRFGGAQRDAAKAQISNLAAALDTYRLDMHKYPNSLDALIKNPGSNKRWNGPYLPKPVLPKDPWGNEYQYKKPGTHGTDYDLYSFGADGREGGEDDDKDVTNWE